MTWEELTVWLSGATGSWGQEFCRQLLQKPIRKLVCYCRGEHRAARLVQQLQDDRLRVHLGDIRDAWLVEQSLADARIVIHAAALKRIDQTAHCSTELMQVNIQGTQTVIESVLKHDVGKAFYLSSDKAAMPTTVYGGTKFVAEQLWLGANVYSPAPAMPWFSATRFGNALGSAGSVLRVWEEEQRQGKPLSVTNPHMTRFVSTLEDMVRMTLDVYLSQMKGGELFCPPLPACTIADLAAAFAPGYPVNVIGGRGFGEKEHETFGPGGPTSDSVRRLSVPELQQLLARR